MKPSTSFNANLRRLNANLVIPPDKELRKDAVTQVMERIEALEQKIGITSQVKREELLKDLNALTSEVARSQAGTKNGIEAAQLGQQIISSRLHNALRRK